MLQNYENVYEIFAKDFGIQLKKSVSVSFKQDLLL